MAYYIAAINIEAVYHSLVGGEYHPYEGICLTDTFQLYEKDDLISELLVDNSDRRKRQKELDIRVIVGNPPYSTGQKNADDNNQNVTYDQLDNRIRDTYGKHSTATLQRNLFDSYIRAIRWASDRIGDSGIIGFVSGSGFIEKPAMNGMRKCLAEDFSSIYVFNLRGDIRKNMLSQGRAKEGQNIFGSGSMTGIAISILVKNPNAKIKGQIYHANIGDDLTTQEKLEVIKETNGIDGVFDKNLWHQIVPDAHNDWVAQRDTSFDKFIKIGEKKEKNTLKIFNNYSL
ncbi:MAG: hypothetical protein L3J44_08085, partial [Campylobacteraceae bacterium]|nr:hypothetical protein [Campylobacteraceae bacterium]